MYGKLHLQRLIISGYLYFFIYILVRVEEEFNGWVVCFFWKYGLLKVLCLRIDYLHNYLFISCCWVKNESLFFFINSMIS